MIIVGINGTREKSRLKRTSIVTPSMSTSESVHIIRPCEAGFKSFTSKSKSTPRLRSALRTMASFALSSVAGAVTAIERTSSGVCTKR